MTNILPVVDVLEVSATVRKAINRYMSENGTWEPEEFAYWSRNWNGNNEILRFIAEIQAQERILTASQIAKVSAIAKVICRQHGSDPLALEPGDSLGIDRVLPNGDPAHFMWKEYVEFAEDILASIENLNDPSSEISVG